MKKIQLFLCYAIAGGCIFSFLMQKQPTHVFSPMLPFENDAIMIYALNEQKQLVPITLSFEKSEDDEENIQQMMDQMKQTLDVADLDPVFPRSISCLGVAIQENVVKLNFNEAFLAMNSMYELRMIEAIVSSITHLNEQYLVEFTVNHEIVQEMPLSHLAMKRFDKTFGVNHFENTTAQLHDSVMRQVVRFDENKGYYSVSALRSQNHSDLDFINTVLDETSHLLECVKLEVIDDTLIFVMNSEVLSEEGIVDNYKMLPLLYTMKMNHQNKKFKVVVEDEEAAVIVKQKKITTFEDLHLNRLNIS